MANDLGLLARMYADTLEMNGRFDQRRIPTGTSMNCPIATTLIMQ